MKWDGDAEARILIVNCTLETGLNTETPDVLANQLRAPLKVGVVETSWKLVSSWLIEPTQQMLGLRSHDYADLVGMPTGTGQRMHAPIGVFRVADWPISMPLHSCVLRMSSGFVGSTPTDRRGDRPNGGCFRNRLPTNELR
jgi:hypothetical protein